MAVCFALWNASQAAALLVPALLVSTWTCWPSCFRSTADTSVTSVSCSAKASCLVFSISVLPIELPVRASSMSTVTRILSPLAPIVPLTIVPTLSAFAMLSGATSFPLYGITPLRDVTCSALTVPSSWMSASVSPSDR